MSFHYTEYIYQMNRITELYSICHFESNLIPFYTHYQALPHYRINRLTKERTCMQIVESITRKILKDYNCETNVRTFYSRYCVI